MLPSLASVDLSRWQFAIDASYHFLFVPLTLGLAWMLFTMECCYVITGKEVYKDMTRFWGKLFGINFALGVLTGLTMEFQFGTNWAYYSQYVGDIFGTPLAIEGLVAFMLESTFFGIFFFGWDKLTKKQHLFATFCLAFGSSISALLILVANGFMQHPVGGYFDLHTMRMQTSSLWDLVISPFAQIGFAHTVIAGYTTGAMFVFGISGYYLWRNKYVDFAKRSFAIAAGFGLVASIMVCFLGDQNGILVAKYQPMKLAAIEAEWTTQTPPANFNAITIPSQSQEKNIFSLQIPKLLGLLATHSLHAKVMGIKPLLKQEEHKMALGKIAYDDMVKLREGVKSKSITEQFNKYKKDLGYGLLLQPFVKNITTATPQQIKKVAVGDLPNVAVLFWSFRIMVAAGIAMIFLFLFGLIGVLKQSIWKKKWFHRLALYSLPLPWIACLCGWFVTEHGRQPWTVYGILPTAISSSSIDAVDVAISLSMFVLLYTGFFIVEMYLMIKFARKGPSVLAPVGEPQ